MHLHLIQSLIHEIRGYRVMLDSDLAALYETETKRLKEAVRRNINRFPPDFMFELNESEFETLRTQFATSNRGGTRYMPFAFTEQGVAMLASVLNSPKAIEVNIQIVRAFVFLRQYAIANEELARKLNELESMYNKQFKDIYEALNYLLTTNHQQKLQNQRRKIGFVTEPEK
ncbi:MAG TPA: ORF6N domain-containing protein [Bacteroidales bacterium]|nr:ORF6N domain-containing protein [Bacteroidales bacterium]